MNNLTDLKVAGNPLKSVAEHYFKGKVLRLDLIRSYTGELANELQPDSDDEITVEREEDLTSHANFKTFMVDLGELMENEYKLFPFNPLPRIVRACVNFILANGITLEGIFRLAGLDSHCKQIREDWDNGVKSDFDDDDNPHNAAHLLKQWLRDRKEPILLVSNFDPIIQMADFPEEEIISKFEQVLAGLPLEHYAVVKQLFRLMYIVGQNAETNRMDHGNISLVFGPSLLFLLTQDPLATMTTIKPLNEVITIVCKNYPIIFEKSTDFWKIDYLLDAPVSGACTSSLTLNSSVTHFNNFFFRVMVRFTENYLDI
jgi:hypothetical protein